MNDDFDELDRALFALPLETPPPGLRESILNATVYAQARAALEPVARPWEAWLAGGALAVAVWLGAGAAVAAWLLFFNSLGLRLPLRGARS